MNPLELLYYLGHVIKTRQDLRRRKRLPSRVISIGNITVGGTGKTPATIGLARAASARGLIPVILTRGYRGRIPGPCFVGGEEALTGAPDRAARHLPLDPSLYGDEPVLMAEKLSGVPVVKCADRHRGGMFALESIPEHLRSSVVFILDDGFQHRRLHRDLDIVLIDGLSSFGNGRLFPLGPLREPLTGLRRADLFVVTRAVNERVRRQLRSLNPDAPVFTAVTTVTGLVDLAGKPVSFESLSGRSFCGFCGVGNPESFRRTLQVLPGKLVGFKSFGDHHRYRRADLHRLKKWAAGLGCDLLVTTDKDRVKLRGKEVSEGILAVEISLELGEDLLASVFGRIGAEP